MQGILQKILRKRKENNRTKHRFVSIVLILSLIVSTEVFWILRRPGVAMAGDADCGITEHTHTDECGESCEITEHVHSLECYSNESADVEDRATWEHSLAGVQYTDDFAKDLAAVAKTQIGYTESALNFKVDENKVKNGYTRYGAWYGNPYGEWSGMFAAFCLYYNGVPIGVIPMHSGVEAARVAWMETGLYSDTTANASIGDLLFSDTDSDNEAEHIGIVTEVNEDLIRAIVGDYDGRVIEVEYGQGSLMGLVKTSEIETFMKQSGAERVERSVSDPSAVDLAALTLDSSTQIINYGGANVASDGTRVSKVISGTPIENIFDITLTIETQQKIQQIYKEPDMAVVIVMDISNTMNNKFGDTDRYSAAMEAASDFIEHFADTAGNVSKIGYVAFNTSAYKIFDLQSCNTQAKAQTLISQMETATDKIIHASGYAASNDRYTNIEAGLKMGWDMIKNTSQEHKYVIFLSDGFPTTYLKNHNGTDYVGYPPVSGSGTVGSDGVFYDAVWKKYLDSGCSYSDKGAIYARQMATKIKNEGGTIFSIGVDVGGQTINGYLYKEDGSQAYHVVDRSGTTYEIGSATSAASYKNWLKNSIGSGYYYDSTDTAGLKNAYESIFNEIQHMREEESKAEWIAFDPLPIMERSTYKTVEFIGFYEKDKDFIPLSTSNTVSGTHTEGGENSAFFDEVAHEIDWDLKNSGYHATSSAGLTTYKYELVYRVRLRNEDPGFHENEEYDTNDKTTLTYRIIETVNGETVISDDKSIDFPIPSVKGYLGELEFNKVDPHGNAVVGAEFTLIHDHEKCNICHGDGTPTLTVPDYTAVSGEDGKVVFTEIPSGHKYRLVETKVPEGYLDTGRKYYVTVAYNTTAVSAVSGSGASIPWDATVLNNMPYALPKTGGAGEYVFIAAGTVLILAPIMYFLAEIIKKRKNNQNNT